MTNSSSYVAHSASSLARKRQSLADLAGPKTKAGSIANIRAKCVPAGLIKGRVAAQETIAAHTDTGAAHTDCAREERTIPAPTCAREERTIPAPTAPTAVACAIVTGSGSGRRDSCTTSNGVIAEIGTDAIGAAHRAAMNASNRAGRERTADNGFGL